MLGNVQTHVAVHRSGSLPRISFIGGIALDIALEGRSLRGDMLEEESHVGITRGCPLLGHTQHTYFPYFAAMWPCGTLLETNLHVEIVEEALLRGDML